MVVRSKKTSRINRYLPYNESTGIATLDPAFAKNQSIMWSVHQLYNTLVEIDSGLNIVPSLAKSWEVSADRLTYTFHLRTGIFFHDNDAFPMEKEGHLQQQMWPIACSGSSIKTPPAAAAGSLITAWIHRMVLKRWMILLFS
jgi:oligopeptide transport system substrate-binding protein